MPFCREVFCHVICVMTKHFEHALSLRFLRQIIPVFLRQLVIDVIIAYHSCFPFCSGPARHKRQGFCLFQPLFRKTRANNEHGQAGSIQHALGDTAHHPAL